MNRNVTIALAISLVISSSQAFAAPPQDKGGLPKGLQKKAQRGDSLPPGWQKKLQTGDVLDPLVFKAGEVVYRDSKQGVLAIEVDDKIIRLVEGTHQIIDVLSSL